MAGEEMIPRWAKKAAATIGKPEGELWERINDLLHDGWQPSRVVAELSIPKRQERSLEVHAEKYKHRRILAPLARANEVLARGGAVLAPKFRELLKLCVEQALSEPADARRAQRTGELLTDFFALLNVKGKDVAKAEAEREKREPTRKVFSPDEAAQRIRDLYGIPDDGGGGDAA